jgi:RNA polymerase sigma factor (sigma-70 family)
LVETADLIQDVVARTLPNLDRFEPDRERALQAYLRTAVDNRIRDELRRMGRRPPQESLEECDTMTVYAEEPSPLANVLKTESDRLLARALSTLNQADQAAVVARLRLGYSYEQVALVLRKRSANSARMAVTRAIERLIDAMQREVGGAREG